MRWTNLDGDIEGLKSAEDKTKNLMNLLEDSKKAVKTIKTNYLTSSQKL